MNKLVYGGTPKFLSNRAVEKGCELVEVESCVVDMISIRIFRCRDIEELVYTLYDLSSESINFVGSRDYVYMTPSMISVIEALQTEPNPIYDHFRQLTRCCGLRDKVMELMGVEGLK